MDLHKAKISLTIGLPHSKVIDNILALRDPEIQLDYYTIYALSIFNNAGEKSRSEYVLPLFSFNGQLYYLTCLSEDNYEYSSNDYQIINSYFQNIEIKKELRHICLFNDINLSVYDFERMLISTFDNNLIKYFVEKAV